MREDLCLCALIPRLELATRVIVIATKREIIVPTNTGRLAAQALTNSAILVRGVQDAPIDLQGSLLPGRPSLLPGRPSLLLYPAAEAEELTADFLNRHPGPHNLIVPDGNWRQTTKMRRRDPFLATLPMVKLPPGPPSTYRVRKETKAEGLATLEAIARALGVMEGAEVQKSLELIMQAMVLRVLQSRGSAVDNAAPAGEG
jgi:DTW domain-containing protein YfiP